MIQELSPAIPVKHDAPAVGDENHPMRKVTRQVAFEPNGWTPARRAKVADLFDGLAEDWHTRFAEGRDAPLRDALERGNVASGRCLEIGCGLGTTAHELAQRFDTLIAADLSAAMLRRAPATVKRLRADASELPMADGAVDVVILENMLLFPNEMARVLAPGGTLVWVSSLGDKTPIYLSADDVARALPGDWTGTASAAGWGTWCALRRA